MPGAEGMIGTQDPVMGHHVATDPRAVETANVTVEAPGGVSVRTVVRVKNAARPGVMTAIVKRGDPRGPAVVVVALGRLVAAALGVTVR